MKKHLNLLLIAENTREQLPRINKIKVKSWTFAFHTPSGMWQIVRSKLCSSVLLALLLFSLTTTTVAIFSMDDCGAMNQTSYADCICCVLPPNNQDDSIEYEIKCPVNGTDSKIKVRISYYSGYANLQITIKDIEGKAYQLLPAMDLGDVYDVSLLLYSVPREPISHLLQHLNMTKLEHLTIKYSVNLKANITRDHFSGLTDLISLSPHSFDLSLVPEDLFADLENLTSLTFEIGNIQNVPNIFAPLANLEHLSLNIGNLEHLPVGVFRKQRNLKYLKICCQLRNISRDLFTATTSLKTLELRRNKIKSLHPDVFSLLTHIEEIILSENYLQQLPSRIFANSANYNSISLASNELASVDATLFANKHSLRYLNLRNNRLKSLPDELFRYQRILETLDLSCNQLTEISSTIFGTLFRLRYLNMANNSLVTISPDAFIKTKGLNHIIMENNQIDLSDIVNNQIESYPINELKSPFQFLIELRTLRLRNNSLRYIFSDWRNKMENLELLDLSYNKITSLSHSDLLFHSKTDLSIDLSYNHISNINFQNITKLDTSTKSSTSVQLNNNPLNCDCNLLPFVEFVRQINRTIDELFCETPESMKDLNVHNAVPKKLLCPLESPYCPHDCRCWKRTYDMVLVVNCSNKNLKEIPALPRAQLLALNSTVLHIENNVLCKLPTDFSTTGYANVTEIHAAGNSLYQIDLRNLPRNLTYLDLSRNKFQELSNEVLNFFNQSNSSRQISLSKNPWNCECKNKPLLVFAAQSNTRITDVDNVYCARPTDHKMTDYYFSNDICQDDQSMAIALIVGFSVVGISISIIAVLYYKYQTEIKVWMYRYRICSCCVNEKELDKDKKYDAFISYSHKDELFIAEHLVRELEEGPIPFKLCIYVRDFIIGECIPDQIINAIDNSRRTIIVLSENFINSVWARMEFRLAHKAALNEGRARVIVIIYGNIQDIKTLDEDLQAYLKMNIYLEWGDPRFWDRLRYAMPHTSRKLNKLVQIQ